MNKKVATEFLVRDLKDEIPVLLEIGMTQGS